MPLRASASSDSSSGSVSAARIHEIGQQAEMEIGIAIGEESDLQRLDQARRCPPRW